MRKRVIFILHIMVFVMSLFFTVGSASAKKINVAFGGPPFASLDPTAWGGGNFATFYNVHETLIGFNAKQKMTGILAKSWSFSKTGKVLTVKLRKNIRFSTGEKLTAKDVVFSLERAKEKHFAVKDQLHPSVYSRAEAVDDLTVKFYFPKTNVQFLPQTLNFAWIVSKEQFDKLGEKKWSQNPSGTGPYIVVGWKPGRYVDIAINKNYRGKKPQVTEAHFVYAPQNETRINMLKAGEADLINQMDWKIVKQIERAGFKRYDMIQAHDVAIQFHLFNPNTPWANKKVRQAINYALDKKLIRKKLFNDVPREGVWQLPWELGYNKKLKPSYPYNLRKAKQLMKEAGYEKGFEMPLIYLTDPSWSKDMVDYVTTALKQLKINCKVTPIGGFPPFMEKMREISTKKNTKAVVLFNYGWPGNPEPMINLTNGFWSGKPNSLYSRPDLDKIIEEALVTLNNRKRGKLINKAYKIINDDLPFIPLMLEVDVHMMKKNIRYKPSYSIMNAGPMNIFDLTIK